jgi:CheY-like chemotaxis protein
MTEPDDDLGALPEERAGPEFKKAVLPDEFGPAEFKLSVLVVDDHPTHRRYAQAIFEALECVVALAESGAAALRACSARRFDVVIMDRHMPDGHGDDAVRRLRRREGRARRTFVACCSSDPPSDLSAGYDAIAPKPLTVAAATELLRHAATRVNLAPPTVPPGS